MEFNSNIMENNTNSFMQYFINNGIRVAGTVSNPLFCASDIGHYLDDTSIRRKLAKCMSSYTVKIKHKTPANQIRSADYFTLVGLYRYLFTIKVPPDLPLIIFIESNLQNLLNNL